MRILVKIVVIALAILLAAELVSGISVSSFGTAVVVALVLGIINTIVRPILFFLTLPITLLTLGLFALVLNVLLFWATAFLVPGFDVASFVDAILGSLIVAAAHSIVDHLFRSNRLLPH